ncbi:MAG: hemagglutinin, partial [Verrucomicrobiaceae bacterium]|nr:hemagglutinin [Verrucomicrobiaceae bacterium]
MRFRFLPLFALLASVGSLSATATTFFMDKVTDVVAPGIRGATTTTYFGWETFNEVGNRLVPIDDSTPDIGTTATGVRFLTTSTDVHVSNTSGNYYSFGTTPAETVSVVTDGAVGGAGFTTIIAQFVTSGGPFPDPVVLGPIDGASPTVVQGTNKAGRGQIWALWRVAGNQATYTFTVSGVANHYTFDRVVVDTAFSTTGFSTDSMVANTPALASVMDKISALVESSSRGTANTTWFGWENFSDVNGTFTGVINDSTPDIGTAVTGANFRTTNGQVHELGSGNIYFPTTGYELAEEVTVPTSGTVGSTGFTTIIAQIQSAPGFGAFADTITLGSIEDVAPTVVQSLTSSNIGLLWAKWQIPGNKASYTFTITGPDDTPHFSFDRMVVDTKFSTTGFVDDTMIASELSIAESLLPAAQIDTAYSPVTFTATAGTTPYTWAVSAGALPTGMALSTAGVLSGTPTVAGSFNFTVEVTDHLDNTATKAFALTTAVGPVISTAPLLADIYKGVNVSIPLANTGGTAPFTWIKSAGDLPDGLSVNSAGILSGTPSTTGEFTFTAQITDDNGFTAAKEFQITVKELSITTPSSLTGAVKGLAYSATFSASGGSGTLTWTKDSGTLPAGLTLSPTGVLSGKPTVPVSNAAFTIKVTDASNFSATKAFTLTVTATYLKPVLTQPVLGTTTVGVPFSFTPVATNYPSSFTV